ncbi:DUF2306 domain-containing protein [Parasphingopyxis algicola]|uniref:DUF2306 domain-containing protein n=1 Tax=Parasphingopyxis algicola TaxID=2026624 RepID=UPI0015A1A309|nr:DUF2306 domain-containing protein [Parasphingopyxis algicola]QLC25600.1 DUF2306 domain-containing protein [Parasphingopyxis algicola]
MTRAAAYMSGRLPVPAMLAIAGGTVVVTFALMALSYGSGRPSDNAFSPAVAVHLASVLPALPIGALILYGRKGDARHRLLGRIWVMLMLVAAISSFWFALSFIHIFSLVVLVSVPLSLWRLRQGDITGHRRAMEGMYIGLVIAGAFAFIPGRFLGDLAFG